MDEAESDGLTIYMGKVYGKVNGVSVEVCSIDDYPAYKGGGTMKAQAKANSRYRAKSCKSVTVQFFPSDMELYEHLEKQDSKAGYIKRLIREDMQGR